MAQSPSTTAPELRAEGNTLYREGKFHEGEPALILHEPRKLTRHRSQKKHQQCKTRGRKKHVECMSVIRKALPQEMDQAKTATLNIRMAKCYLYLGRPVEVEKALEGVPDCQAVGKILELLKESREDTPAQKKEAWKDVVALPRFRPTMLGVPEVGSRADERRIPTLNEYFPRGHDEAVAAMPYETLLADQRRDPSTSASSTAQLYHLHAYRKKNASGGDKFVFTMQDLKSHAMANNMMLLKLLLDAAAADTEKKRVRLLATVWFMGNRCKYKGGVKGDRRQFEGSLIVSPPPIILQEHEPELAGFIEANKTKSATERKKSLSEYARKYWRTNVALLQETEWYHEYIHTRGSNGNTERNPGGKAERRTGVPGSEQHYTVGIAVL
ncbi:hypothetical protein FN846DRAFT_894541 [Sphaerosporella brunnea]|uniref:Uncharacterized protein n=1 Tax=Sphaerosporella brunnea TaxID=1250544 RepID=A0A5J5EHW8_9PEZI|nr:hypothetical protein FN846DRAFT_894541 [Sphaerosporella brunnea]